MCYYWNNTDTLDVHKFFTTNKVLKIPEEPGSVDAYPEYVMEEGEWGELSYKICYAYDTHMFHYKNLT